MTKYLVIYEHLQWPPATIDQIPVNIRSQMAKKCNRYSSG